MPWRYMGHFYDKKSRMEIFVCLNVRLYDSSIASVINMINIGNYGM